MLFVDCPTAIANVGYTVVNSIRFKVMKPTLVATLEPDRGKLNWGIGGLATKEVQPMGLYDDQ